MASFRSTSSKIALGAAACGSIALSMVLSQSISSRPAPENTDALGKAVVAPPKNPVTALEEAIAGILASDISEEEALQALERVREAHSRAVPDDELRVRCAFAKGSILLLGPARGEAKRERLKKALEEFEAALRLDPSHPGSRAGRAKARAELEELESAAEIAVHARKELAAARKEASSLIEQRQWARAIQAFRAVPAAFRTSEIQAEIDTDVALIVTSAAEEFGRHEKQPKESRRALLADLGSRLAFAPELEDLARRVTEAIASLDRKPLYTVGIPPVRLTAEVDVKGVTLKWTLGIVETGHKAAKTSGFVVERRVAAGEWKTLSSAVTAYATSYRDTDLQADTAYEYRVSARTYDPDYRRERETDRGDPSEPCAVRTLDPFRLEVTGGTGDRATVKLTCRHATYGPVSKEFSVKAGDRIGFIDGRSKHRVELGKNRTVEVDFDCGYAVTKVAHIKETLEQKACDPKFGSSGKREGCTLRKQPLIYDAWCVKWTTRSGEERESVSTARPDPDKRCGQHRGK